MSEKKTYKIVSNELDLVLFVKGFSLENEKKLYSSIRNKIEVAQDPISIESYQEFIVEKFLVGAQEFIGSLSEDKEERKAVITAAYQAITGLYPPFALDFVCQDLNTSTFFSKVEGKFLQHLKERGMMQPPPPEGITSIQLSSIEELERLDNYLKDNIIGQRNAIQALMKSLKLMASGLAKHSSFLFVGPTGVGKTQLGRLVGGQFSGNFYKINCAEYAGAHEYSKLIGAPPGYIGHTETSLLGEKAEQSNRWVFLFDEIEKAHHKLYDFLLSILDEGTCTDNLGNTLDFSESIFIFTSNQGLGEIKRDSVGFDRDKEVVSKKVTQEVIHNSIKKHFSPEFLNRLDDTIFFDSLSRSEVKKIASLQLDELPIEKTDALVEFVVDGGYSDEYGARNIARFIKNNISDKVADAILGKLIPKKTGNLYTPRIVKGTVKIINTKKYQTSSV